MSDANNLTDLFIRKLGCLYDAEQRLVKTLPKLEKAASSPELKQAFKKHLGETEMHVERLTQLFGLFDRKPESETSDAIKGIIDAGDDIAKLDADEPVKDAGLIAAAQVAEHFEIAEYGTLKTWAQVIDKPDAVQLLDWTLEEEENADRKLTSLARHLNFQAALPRTK